MAPRAVSYLCQAGRCLLTIAALIALLPALAGGVQPVAAAQEPILHVTHSSGADPLLGGQVTYDLGLSNTSAGPAPSGYGYNVSITDTLPPGVQFTGASLRTSVGAPTQALAPTAITAQVLPSGLTQQTLTFVNVSDLA